MKGRRKTTSIRLPDELMGRIRVAAITHEHASALTREMFGIEES